jgi:hypothetical protein
MMNNSKIYTVSQNKCIFTDLLCSQISAWSFNSVRRQNDTDANVYNSYLYSSKSRTKTELNSFSEKYDPNHIETSVTYPNSPWPKWLEQSLRYSIFLVSSIKHVLFHSQIQIFVNWRGNISPNRHNDANFYNYIMRLTLCLLAEIRQTCVL